MTSSSSSIRISRLGSSRGRNGSPTTNASHLFFINVDRDLALGRQQGRILPGVRIARPAHVEPGTRREMSGQPRAPCRCPCSCLPENFVCPHDDIGLAGEKSSSIAVESRSGMASESDLRAGATLMRALNSTSIRCSPSPLQLDLPLPPHSTRRKLSSRALLARPHQTLAVQPDRHPDGFRSLDDDRAAQPRVREILADLDREPEPIPPASAVAASTFPPASARRHRLSAADRL